MRGRGRNSVASLAIVKPDGSLEPKAKANGEFPSAPGQFDEKSRNLWDEIVRTKPSDWFDEATLPLLEAYVFAKMSHDRVSSQLAALSERRLKTEKGMFRYRALSGIRQSEAALMASLATKMRLAQQSRYTTKAAATAANKAGHGKKPWEE